MIKGAVGKGDEGIKQLIAMTVGSSQTPQTAGKLDEFKAAVIAALEGGELSDVLKAQVLGSTVSEDGADNGCWTGGSASMELT